MDKDWRCQKVKVVHSCLTLCDPMDCIVHGILQAKILEWVAFPFLRDLPNPEIKSRSPALQVDSLPAEQQGKPRNVKDEMIKIIEIGKERWKLFKKWNQLNLVLVIRCNGCTKMKIKDKVKNFKPKDWEEDGTILRTTFCRRKYLWVGQWGEWVWVLNFWRELLGRWFEL